MSSGFLRACGLLSSIMKLCDMEDYFPDPSTSSASFIANKIAKILEDRFIKICAKNYGQVFATPFATLMLKVVVINLDYIDISKIV